MATQTLQSVRHFRGEYSERGYTVFCNSRPIYSAGNSKWDSQGYEVPDGGNNTYSVDVIKEFCQLMVDENIDNVTIFRGMRGIDDGVKYNPDVEFTDECVECYDL